MTALILALLFSWIAAAIGRVLLNKLHLFVVWTSEATAYAAALGLGIAAYGVYVIGLMGLLTFWPVTLWWSCLALLGWKGSLANGNEITNWITQLTGRLRSKSIPSSANVNEFNVDEDECDKVSNLDSVVAKFNPAGSRILIACSFVILVIFGLITVLACFRPPGPLEWDAISYHLADPKLFLLQHRIVSLPTEHHSNFPFTMEMLYTVGLLYNGYALANLFHAIMAVLTILGLIGFCRRTLAPLVGWLASIAFISTPIVLWEASTAYIDIGLALYLTLAAFACIAAIIQQRSTLPESASSKSSWILLAGALMGFGLGVKYLALVPLALLTLMLALNHVSIKLIAIYIGVALLIGSPWYLKSAIVMSNPVYPFYYSIFPQSKYWSADRAAAYQSEQNKFGTKSISVDARSKMLNLASAPWDLLTQRLGGSLYCNPGEYTFTALYGGLFAALIFPLAFLRRVPSAARYLLWLGVGQIVIWFFLSQVGRYLIQSMPLLAIVGAFTAYRWAFPTWQYDKQELDIKDDIDNQDQSRGRIAQTLPGWIGIALIFGQAVYVLLSICVLPMHSGTDNADLVDKGELPSSISLPAMLANLGHSESWEEELTRYYGPYEAIKWINSNTPPTSGVVLYEETRGYYLDRDYLWGNQQHSAFIPYASLRNGQELTEWMNKQNIYYALINLEETPQNRISPRDSEFPYGTNGNELAALHKWFAQESTGLETHGRAGDDGHQLVSEAIQRQLWHPVYWRHGCVVLEIGKASNQNSMRNTSDKNHAIQDVLLGGKP